jgi:subtilisin family serine protease
MRRVLLVLTVGLVLPGAARAATPDGTGRLLVTLKPGVSGKRSGHAVAAAATARPSGFSVPQIRLVTVAPRKGESLRALAARLRADPRVASVAPERRGAVRFSPNDPALYTPETAKDTAPGTYVEWWAARSGFLQAWDISQGAGATVAVIDTGADISHPDLAPERRGAADLRRRAVAGGARHDRARHARRVARVRGGQQRRRARRRRPRLPPAHREVGLQRL